MLSKQNHGSVKAEVSFRINKKQVTVAVFKTKKWPNQKNTNALVIASSYQVLTFFFFPSSYFLPGKDEPENAIHLKQYIQSSIM